MNRRTRLAAAAWSIAALGSTTTFGQVTSAVPDERNDSTLVVAAAFDRRTTDAACGGQSVSPAITWHGQPPGTRSLAILLESDREGAPRRVEWLAYNIAAERGELREGEGQATGVGISVGRAGDGAPAYRGMCPLARADSDAASNATAAPERSSVLTVVASDLSPSVLPEGLDWSGVTRALAGHVLATSRTVAPVER